MMSFSLTIPNGNRVEINLSRYCIGKGRRRAFRFLLKFGILAFGILSFGIMSIRVIGIRDNVHSGMCPFGILDVLCNSGYWDSGKWDSGKWMFREKVLFGILAFGQLDFGQCYIREIGIRAIVCQG